MTEDQWSGKAARAQTAVLESIPEQWKLAPEWKSLVGVDALHVPAACGLLTQQQIEITRLTASELLAKIHSRQVRAVEAAEAFLIRAAIAHQLLNCLVEFYPEQALAEARAQDAYQEKTGQVLGPLHGLPMAIKDIHEVEGRVVTMALVAWLDNKPCKTDSSTVKIMRDAGAVFFGRTTMPQTGMALETVSNLWGRTLNPYNPLFGSGGSSGGDAVLVAMNGEPAAPITTDIGGSIRAPAAFNGLYAMRPTSERVPKSGMVSAAKGNTSIKVSAGPCCRSMADLKLFVRLILTHPTLPYEPTCCMPFWNEPIREGKKLRFALMTTDGVVDPHPPVQRALRESAEKLTLSGHEVVDFRLPFDFWDAALTTWALYFQTGAKEVIALLEQEGEAPIKQFQHNREVFKSKELSVPELFRHNNDQAAYKAAFQRAWDDAGIDCIICPCAPAAGVPHDFPVWWGYTSIWNLLDYPSIVLPMKGFEICAKRDARDVSYRPRSNPYDEANWRVYDPELWRKQPVTIQVVGRPYRDEALIAVGDLVDHVVNVPTPSG